MIIWSSINCPTVICSPTVCYFSREKPLVKSTAPGLFFIIFAFAIYFYLLLFSDLLIQKYLAAISSYLFYLAFPRDLFIQSTTILPILLSVRDGNPSLTSGCKYLFFVCRRCLGGVAWFSYWFDNLDLITEGNTYHCCAASSLPLWGNTNVASSVIKRNS